MKLSQLLTAKDHKNAINRWNRILAEEKKTMLLREDIVKKIEWHTEQFTIKTGQLPE